MSTIGLNYFGNIKKVLHIASVQVPQSTVSLKTSLSLLGNISHLSLIDLISVSCGGPQIFGPD